MTYHARSEIDVLGNLVGEEVGEQVPLNLGPRCLGLAAQTALEKAVAGADYCRQIEHGRWKNSLVCSSSIIWCTSAQSFE